MSQNIIDKIINHLVSAYFLLPAIEPVLVDQNVATRLNKGTHYGLNLLKKYLNKIKNEEKIYALKFDISKYFFNLDHDIIKELIRKRIKDKDALKLLDSIIDSTDYDYINEKIEVLKKGALSKNCNGDYINREKIKEINKLPHYKKGKGLPIGNLSSQILAIYYLNELDHYIIEKLNIKYYIRYMDDGVLLHHDKEYLKYCFK